MLTGCGIDIEEPARFERFISQSCTGPGSLINDIFSEREIRNNSGTTALLRYTAGFCCKEAFYKAIGGGEIVATIDFREIELLFEGPGLLNYHLEFSGKAQEVLNEKNIELEKTDLVVTDAFIIFKIILK